MKNFGIKITFLLSLLLGAINSYAAKQYFIEINEYGNRDFNIELDYDAKRIDVSLDQNGRVYNVKPGKMYPQKDYWGKLSIKVSDDQDAKVNITTYACDKQTKLSEDSLDFSYSDHEYTALFENTYRSNLLKGWFLTISSSTGKAYQYNSDHTDKINYEALMISKEDNPNIGYIGYDLGNLNCEKIK